MLVCVRSDHVHERTLIPQRLARAIRTDMPAQLRAQRPDLPCNRTVRPRNCAQK